MSNADLARLVVLAAIWGASYALMRVAAPILGGVGTAWVRMFIAGLLLCAYALAIGSRMEWRKYWKLYMVVGILNSVIPFSLIAFAMKSIPANYGSLLNALSPLFAALFAATLLGDPLTPRKVTGMALGFLGVAFLVGLGPIELSAQVLLAAGASVIATAFYGYASVYTKMHARHAPNLGLAAGALLLPAIPFAVVAVPTLPTELPSITVVFAALVLAVVCSAVAYLLYFRLIRDVGPAKALSVTFLIPVFGTLWGALFLREEITINTIAGAATILAGMALVLDLKIKRRLPA